MCSYLRISMLDSKMIIHSHISPVNQRDLLYNLFEHSQGTLPIVNNISLSLPFSFLLLFSTHSYAKIHIPIIASVSEHQPTTWVSFFFDLHILVCTFPAGLWFCIKNINDERVFGRKILLLLAQKLFCFDVEGFLCDFNEIPRKCWQWAKQQMLGEGMRSPNAFLVVGLTASSIVIHQTANVQHKQNVPTTHLAPCWMYHISLASIVHQQ